MDPNTPKAPPVQETVDPSQDFEPPAGFPKKVIFIVAGLIILIAIVIAAVIILPRFKTAQSGNVTLTYWGLWEDPAVFSSLFSDFTREHPNITVKYEKQDIKKLGKYIERLRTRIDNGSGPDLYRFHNSWVIQLKDFLVPLPTDIVAVSEIDKKYFPVVTKDLNRNGAYYGIPLGIDTLALFVNNKIVQAGGVTVPVNWDEFLKTSLHLTVKNEDNKIQTSGVGMGTFDNVTHATDIISLLMVQNGADLQSIGGTTRKSSEQALAYYTFFAKKGDGNNAIWDENQENSKLAFAKGKTALFFGYSWDIAEIKDLAPDLDFSVVSVPKIAGGKESSIASYWVEGVSARSKHQKEALELLAFLSKRENLEKLHASQAKVRRFGTPYPRTDMADLLKSDPLLFPFVAQANNAVSTIFPSDTYDEALNAVLNQYLGNAVRSIVNDNNSVESATDALSSGVQQNLDKYGK